MMTRFLFASPKGDIPLNRDHLQRPLLTAPSTPHPFLTLGDYFNTALAFLLEENPDDLMDTALSRRQKHSRGEPITKLVIRSEKQGALYHVASVESAGNQTNQKYVLITALTERSRYALERESETLSFLNRKHPSSGLPTVYCKGDRQIVRGSQKETLSFLLGEWFEGYHEWHVSRDSLRKQFLCIWDQDKGHYTAGEKLFFELFRQAARTLTLLYDPETASQVNPWHHAAGDFVISTRGSEPSVRLTTARGYEPLLTLPAHTPNKTIVNLLFFFLHLGLRMRLDRLDGVGEIDWIEGNILDAVKKGFFEALAMMADEGRFGKTIAHDFLELLRSFSPSELIASFKPLLEIYRERDEEELKVIRKNLQGHVEELFSAIGRFPGSTRVSGTQQSLKH